MSIKMHSHCDEAMHSDINLNKLHKNYNDYTGVSNFEVQILDLQNNL
jgi:hypothetical protein